MFFDVFFQFGYVADYSQKIVGETFTCYRMEKDLK